MAGGKETPRQKMIGMMYLVLTALLALNVSKSILDAFITINDGIETTTTAFNDKLGNQYLGFAASYNENKEKYGKAYELSQTLRQQADELFNHINLIKAKTIAETEKKPMEEIIGKDQFGRDTILNLKYVNGKDNYDVNTNIMIGGKPEDPKDTDHADGNNYRALVLKDKLTAYGENLKAMVAGNPGLEATIDSLFTYPELIKDASGTNVTWVSLNFDHVPLAATTTLLSKLQADVRNAESDVLGHLFQDVDAASYKFTELVPIVLPQKTYILQNDSFRADVFLAAYDNTNLPSIKLAPAGATVDTIAQELTDAEATEVILGSDGRGKIRIPANSVGFKHWEGVIKFRKPTGGGFDYYNYSFDYEVAVPSLVVSPTAMNVLYRGIDNPVAISVPGIPQEALRATISTGSLIPQSDGTYIARVKSGSEAVVSVSAEVDGTSRAMGTFKFRLKSVPDPVAKFAGKYATDNVIKKSELTAALGVRAELKDFVFDLDYPIKSFDMVVIMGSNVKTTSSNGNRLTSEQKDLLKQVRKNQTVVIENIKAQAPDGTVRKLGSINLRVL
jgi:gliding motility-associated protein GldM